MKSKHHHAAAALSIRRIELTEWQSRDVVLTDEELRGILSCSAHVQIQPLRNGVYSLRPTSIVGLINAGKIQLSIAPKCRMPSLLFMLAEVHEFSSLIPLLSGYRQTDDVVDLLAQMFLDQVSRVVRQGLRRSYVTQREELSTARGRIGVRESAALHFRGRPQLLCTFEEFTLNGVENQLLLATLKQISQQPIFNFHRRSLAHRLCEEFIDVSPAIPTKEQFHRLRCDRLNMHYWPAIGLAELIIQHSGIAAHFGEVAGSGFLVDMNQLFEKFVFRKLRTSLAPLNIGTESQRRDYFDEERTAQIVPDLCFIAKTGVRVVGDTKYKTSTTAASSDLYQMLTYCRVMKVRHGVLITVGAHDRIRHTVRDGDTIIDVVSVDLSGTINDVEASISELVAWLSMVMAMPRC